VDRHAILQRQALQQLLDVGRVRLGRYPVDCREMAAAVLLKDRRHVGAADAVVKAELEAVPDLVLREQLVQGLRLDEGHVGHLADVIAHPFEHRRIFPRSRGEEKSIAAD
jgi:hypothetical protein